jgi:competence protein ComEC
MLLSDPYLIYSSGMQLSFCAAYSMAIVYPWVLQKAALLADRKKSEFLYKAGKAAAPGLSVFAGTAPLCVYHFLTFTPLSIILNPFAIALAGIILPAGLLGLAASCIVPAPVSNLFIYLDCSLLSLLLKALGLLNKAGTMLAGSTSVCAPPAALLILYYAFLFFLLSEGRYILHRTRRYFELALIEILLLTAGSTLPFALKISDSIFPWEYGTAKITFLDVGQGDCIHIHYGGKDILIDGGGSYYSNIAEDPIKPYLLKNGIRDIDLAIVTHEDQDHCKGIYELDEIFEINKIITNKDVYGVETEDENDSCIVSSIEIDGAMFLLMSDADIKREDHLLSAYPGLKCDVLKAGHHGSTGSSSERFIHSVTPYFTVLSVGKNNSYGHPAPRVIELLETSGIIYARTDECGAVSLKKADDKELVFVNAAKDRIWRIPKQPRQNTLQGP